MNGGSRYRLLHLGGEVYYGTLTTLAPVSLDFTDGFEADVGEQHITTT